MPGFPHVQALEGLSDVDLGTVSDGQVLQYVSANGLWQNVTLAVAIIPSGIPATKIANGSVEDAEFQYLNGVTSAIQTQLGAKQPLDADLTALAGLDATAGFLARTGAGAFAVRTLTGTTNQVSITNPTGAAGDPVFSLPQSIATTSTPQFLAMGLGTGSPGNVLHVYESSADDMTAGDGSLVIVEQASAGDAAIQFELTGAKIWSLGIDNSQTNDPFCIYDGSTVRLSINGSTGVVTMGAGADMGDSDITNVGNIALDSLTADGTTITIGGTPSIVLTNATTIAITLGDDAGDDLLVDATTLVVEGDNARVGVGTAAPASKLHVLGTTGDTSGLRVQGTAVTIAAYDDGFSQAIIGAHSNHQLGFIVNNVRVAILTTDKALKCLNAGGTPAGASGTAGIFANGSGAACELYGLDAAGNAPQLTPHDRVTGELFLRSTNLHTGRRETLWQERMVHVVEKCAEKLGIAHDPLWELAWLPVDMRKPWLGEDDAPDYFAVQAASESKGDGTLLTAEEASL